MRFQIEKPNKTIQQTHTHHTLTKVYHRDTPKHQGQRQVSGSFQRAGRVANRSLYHLVCLE